MARLRAPKETLCKPGILASPSPSTVFWLLLVHCEPPQTALSNSRPGVTLTESVGRALGEVAVGRTGGFCSALAGPGWEGRGDSWKLESPASSSRIVSRGRLAVGWNLGEGRWSGHSHAASPRGWSGFLTTWWLGSKLRCPRRSWAVTSPRWPSLGSHGASLLL